MSCVLICTEAHLQTLYYNMTFKSFIFFFFFFLRIASITFQPLIKNTGQEVDITSSFMWSCQTYSVNLYIITFIEVVFSNFRSSNFFTSQNLGGDVAQEVRAVVWQSEGCRFDPTLGVSKCPWARHLTPQLLLTSWLAPCMAANRRWCVNVCVNGWMRGINCTALWIKALYKCSPFTI